MKEIVSSRVSKSFLIGLGFLLLGVGIGFSSQFIFPNMFRSPCVSDLTLINPEPDCEAFEAKSKALTALQETLEKDVHMYVDEKKAIRISVFTRDLVSKRFAGVNENELFFMASLLKVPVVIGGYKLAEVEPRVLDETILYNGVPNLYEEQYIKPDEKLEQGKTYTVKELMRRAIVYSDNTAAQILFDYYPKEFLDRILQALGLELKRPSGYVENPVTARTYANVFRSLYNASYLTRKYANDALIMLTQTAYKNGALAKLPTSVVVAHKFAERVFDDPTQAGGVVRQLHECGLVYAHEGKDPYTFCIMTEGTDYAELEKIFQNVSLTIYTAMTELPDR